MTAVLDSLKKLTADKNAQELANEALMGDLDRVAELLPLSTPGYADENQQNALMCAAARGHTDCVRALLSAFDPNAQDKNQMTALIRSRVKPRPLGRGRKARGFWVKKGCETAPGMA